MDDPLDGANTSEDSLLQVYIHPDTEIPQALIHTIQDLLSGDSEDVQHQYPVFVEGQTEIKGYVHRDRLKNLVSILGITGLYVVLHGQKLTEEQLKVL